MTKEELNESLRAEAVGLGACAKGMKGWDRVLDIEELIQLYLKNVEFAIDKNFPSNELIRNNFGRDILAAYGVYVDERLNADNKCGTLVLNGKCTGRLHYGGFSTARIYVRGDSDVKITAMGRSRIFVSVYDNATIRVSQTDVAKVYIYRKSKLTHCVIDSGDVTVREGT